MHGLFRGAAAFARRTLGYSCKSVRWLLWRSSARSWAELHERSFQRLGGALRILVLDNLKEGVLRPDVYEPALNPLYRDVLAHYGATAMPCRVRHPDRKGKVESGIAHAQKMLRGLRFESLEAAQAYLDHWEARWADTRHPRDDQAPGRGHVRRGEARAAGAAERAVSILRVRPAHFPTAFSGLRRVTLLPSPWSRRQTG